jgi:flagellar secretion chaperone FliS
MWSEWPRSLTEEQVKLCMANPIYDAYLEAEVLSATPVKLVAILYRAAIDSVGAARLHLKAGAIRERSRQITRASEIIHELMRTLDHERGGEISRSLAGLYAYMQTRLIKANTQQIDPPLAEVEKLLSTLLEAWGAATPTAAPPPVEAEYTPVRCTY